MKRWDAGQPGYRSRGRGRRRTVPIRPFDAVPAQLVETAKRIFADNWRPPSGRGPSGAGPGGDPASSYVFDNGPTARYLGWR